MINSSYIVIIDDSEDVIKLTREQQLDVIHRTIHEKM